MCGKEFCNAYTELNDPFEQRLRFEEQVRRPGDPEPLTLYLRTNSKATTQARDAYQNNPAQ